MQHNLTASLDPRSNREAHIVKTTLQMRLPISKHPHNPNKSSQLNPSPNKTDTPEKHAPPRLPASPGIPAPTPPPRAPPWYYRLLHHHFFPEVKSTWR